MVAYNLGHLTQNDDQNVYGPIQDDEALFLFALVRTMRIDRILELGGLRGYSARNFLEAMGPNGKLYTVDMIDIPSLSDNHVTIKKNCADVVSGDVDNIPLELIFFDCHAHNAQMLMFSKLRDAGIITDRTVIALHDTNLHPTPASTHHAYAVEGGYVHQAAERRMVNDLHAMGYDAFCAHTTMNKHGSKFPARHGITIMQKFTRLVV